MKSRPRMARIESQCEKVVGVGRGDHRSAEFALDRDYVMLTGELAAEDRGRGRIDTICVQIHELEFAFVRHVARGLHVTHTPPIGTLAPKIE